MKDNQTSEEPILINMSVAASLLGYQSGVVIRNLINEELLRTYRLPDSTRIMVDKREVLALIQPASKKQEPK